MVENKKLILTIELVPQSSWYQNLRRLLPQLAWDKIRKSVYKKFNYKCAICHKRNTKLYCHEAWQYNDKTHVQLLEGFVALCNLCHMVKHIGYAGVLSERGVVDFEKIIKHFMKINKCNRKTFQNHYNKAFEIWEKRSRYEWTLNLNKVKSKVSSPQKSLS